LLTLHFLQLQENAQAYAHALLSPANAGNLQVAPSREEEALAAGEDDHEAPPANDDVNAAE
jgi:hypothetical protein